MVHIMKHLTLFSVLVAASLLVACNKETQEIKFVEDVCLQMEDINFMKYCYDNFDVNHDGIVSMSEAQSVKKIDVHSKDINSLKGIEYFSQLSELDCAFNNLTSLDVSKNTQLISLDCKLNSISSLDVSKNTQLISLDCNENSISSLDVSKNTQLVSLRCYFNNLTSLDLSKNTQLIELFCRANKIVSLDISMLSNLDRHNDYTYYSWSSSEDYFDWSQYGMKIRITDRKSFWKEWLPKNDEHYEWVWK